MKTPYSSSVLAAALLAVDASAQRLIGDGKPRRLRNLDEFVTNGFDSSMSTSMIGEINPAQKFGSGNPAGGGGSGSKSGKATYQTCPAAGGGCLADLVTLGEKFGVAITNSDYDGYIKKDDTFIQNVGNASPLGSSLTIGALEEFKSSNFGTYAIPIGQFKCIGEAFALAASLCDQNSECTYYSVDQINGAPAAYNVILRFFSQASVTALIDSTLIKDGPSVGGFPALRENKVFTAFIKEDVSDPPDFSDVSCDVPPSTVTPLAFACLGVFQSDGGVSLPPGTVLAQFNDLCCGGSPQTQCQGFVDAFNAATAFPFSVDQYCSCGPSVGGPLGGENLVTTDFRDNIAPVATCLTNDQKNFAECLFCVTNFAGSFGCFDGPPQICEADDTKNFITATACADGIQTDGCVCDACGDVCGTNCKKSIQVAFTCQFGSPATTVQDPITGLFVDSGSCLNSLNGVDYSCNPLFL